MNKEFLNRLLTTPSVSGFEEPNQMNVIKYANGFADEIRTDAAGDIISIVNPDSPVKVLLCGHMDEIGFLVSHINDDGTVALTEVGGVHPILYIGSPMLIYHDGQAVPAVGAPPKNYKITDDTKLVLDIGCDSKKDALEYVAPGDVVVADPGNVRELANGNFSFRALDDKTGVYVILEAAKRAKEYGARCGIFAATTTREETIDTGSFYTSANVSPTCSIIVDVTWASDRKAQDPDATMDCRLGGGPALCASSIANKKINRALEAIAAEKNIPLQYEYYGGRSYTDGDTVNKSGRGVPTALVSIPLRYMHSSVEVCNYNDIEWCIDLIAEFLVRLDENFRYEPIEL